MTFAGLAQAANPPAGPGNIEVFAARDMVMIDGYTAQAGQTATITVKRDGRTVGIAQGEVDEAGFMEVNHAPDLCWAAVTPDIRGGDLVEVTFSGASFVDGAQVGSAVVTDVTASPVTPTAEEGDIEGTVTISGTYDVDDVAAGIIDQARFAVEVVNPAMREVGSAIGSRAISWSPGPAQEPIDGGYTVEGTFGDGAFSATFGVQSAADQELVLEGEHIAMSWLANGTGAEELQLGLTMWETGNANGPGAPGCPPGPGAQPPVVPDTATLTTTKGTGSIEVDWTVPEQAPDANAITGYRVSAVDSSVATHRQEVSVEVDGSTTSATIVNLTPGQSYEIQIEADNGQWSDPKTVGVATPGTDGITGSGENPPPDAGSTAPTDVTVTATGTTTADVRWTAAAGATSYEVVATPAGGTALAPRTVTAPATSASLDGLTAGTEYSVVVTALAAGTRAAAAPVLVTTLTTVAPEAVTVTRASAAHEAIALEWTAATPGNAASPVTGYDLVATPVNADGTGGTPLPPVEVGAVTTGTITGLSNGTAYKVAVFAKSETQRSGASSIGLGVAETVTPNDVVTAGRVEFRANRTEWRVQGSAQDTTANTVTLYVWTVNAANPKGVRGTRIGTATVGADGTWALNQRNANVSPGTNNQIEVVSASGGRLLAAVSRLR